jgi:uncharacterized protein YndB with AHSA1/START domain
MPIEDIVHEATYSHPPDSVWNAIATKEGLESWLMETDFREAKVGHTFSFRDRPRPFWDGIAPCKVIEADRPRRFALLWNTKDEHPSTVSWTLTPTSDGGTHLVFRHEGLRGFMGRMMRLGMNKGWYRMVHEGIPYVVDEMDQGRSPTRADVKERFRKGGGKRRAPAKAA